MSLSKANLIEYLSEPSKYKQAKIYLQEVEKDSETIHSIISAALLALLDPQSKYTPVAKLHALRFYKEIFETAQFNVIQEIDEGVEDHIMRIAKYRKQNKQLNRGETYFVEVEKLEASQTNKQLGVSVVLISLEMVMNWATWYPIDFDGEKSRYSDYYDDLRKEGIAFPKNMSYFKPADRQKFQKNYVAWLTKEGIDIPKSLKAQLSATNATQNTAININNNNNNNNNNNGSTQRESAASNREQPKSSSIFPSKNTTSNPTITANSKPVGASTPEQKPTQKTVSTPKAANQKVQAPAIQGKIQTPLVSERPKAVESSRQSEKTSSLGTNNVIAQSTVKNDNSIQYQQQLKQLKLNYERKEAELQSKIQNLESKLRDNEDISGRNVSELKRDYQKKISQISDDFTRAQQNNSNVISSLKKQLEEAVRAQNTAMAASRPDPNSNQQTKTIPVLKQKIEALEKENEDLKAQVTQLTAQIQELEGRISNHKQQIIKKNEKEKQFKTQIAKMELEAKVRLEQTNLISQRANENNSKSREILESQLAEMTQRYNELFSQTIRNPVETPLAATTEGFAPLNHSGVIGYDTVQQSRDKRATMSRTAGFQRSARQTQKNSASSHRPANQRWRNEGIEDNIGLLQIWSSSKENRVMQRMQASPRQQGLIQMIRGTQFGEESIQNNYRHSAQLERANGQVRSIPRTENFNRGVNSTSGDLKVALFQDNSNQNTRNGSLHKLANNEANTSKYHIDLSHQQTKNRYFGSARPSSVRGSGHHKHSSQHKISDIHKKKFFANQTFNQDPRSSTHRNMGNLTSKRAPIFGVHGVDGQELVYNERMFHAFKGSLLDFRLAMLGKKEVFFTNSEIQLRLNKLGRTNEFILTARNLANSELDLQYSFTSKSEKLDPSFKITQIDFRTSARVAPGKALVERFFLCVLSLDFKFCNSYLKIDGRTLTVPLPISILSFCSFINYDQNLDGPFFDKSACASFKTEQFQTDPDFISPKQYFSNYIKVHPQEIGLSTQKYECQSMVTFQFDRDITVLLRVLGVRQKCVLQCLYPRDNKKQETFAELLLQILIFCFREKNTIQNTGRNPS